MRSAMVSGFARGRWDSSYRRRSRLAMSTVPFYRERWRPGAGQDQTTPVEELNGAEFWLCPFVRPWLASREPSLWSGNPAATRDAVQIACDFPSNCTVVEFRRALIDWPWLGVTGPRFAVLLSADAPAAVESRRDAHNLLTLERAAARGPVVLIGTPPEIDAAKSWVDFALLSLARQSVSAHADASCQLIHDEHLGYVAARDRRCGELHVNTRHFYVRAGVGGLAWTAVRQSRPTLVDIRLGGSWTLSSCASHDVPALVAGTKNGGH